MNRLIDRVLSFWFGDLSLDDPKRIDLWFRATPQHDWEIARRFSREVDQALSGALDHLAEDPRGRLTLILLLDQFPRHLFRHTSEAFSGDEAALAHTKEGMAAKQDRQLEPAERLFFYGPLEHSESLADQRLAVANMETFLGEMQPEIAKPLVYFARWIRVHHDAVEKFGRFPWRNRILGRESTASEQEYLEHDPPYFGQW